VDERVRNRRVVGGGVSALVLGAAAVIGVQVYQGKIPAPPPPPAAQKAPIKALGSLASEVDPLHLPSAKKCLPPPSDVEGEDDMASNVGLDYDSVSSSMRSFVPNTLRCVPAGGVAGTVTMSITAGCDGRVASVAVTDPGGLDQGLVECVKDTMRFAEFPAHDLPDGYEFEYPLTFSR
jgi:hypothetical protein